MKRVSRLLIQRQSRSAGTVAKKKDPSANTLQNSQMQQRSSILNRHQNSVLSAMKLRERISLIDACLKTGQLSRAKILYKSLTANTSSSMTSTTNTGTSSAASTLNIHQHHQQNNNLVDIHIHNSFLESFVHSFNPSAANSISQFQELLSWFNSIKQNGITPNVTSFAILLKGTRVLSDLI